MARVAYLITLAGALAPNRWDAPPHTSRELQRALGDCPTAAAACALLQERAHDGNEVNVAATLVRAAREGASRSTLRYLYGAFVLNRRVDLHTRRDACSMSWRCRFLTARPITRRTG